MPRQFTTKQRREIVEYLEKRDGWKCQVCGKVPARTGARVGDRLEIDHVVPLGSVRIGANGREDVAEDDAKFDLKNVRFACGSCNRKRQFEGKSSISELLAGASSPSLPPSLPVPDPNGSRSDMNHSDSGEQPSSNPTVEVHRQLDYGAGSVQMQANDAFEPSFIGYVMSKVRQSDGRHQALRDLKSGGAYVVGCSISTAEDYMEKLTGPEGPLERYRVGNLWLVKLRGQGRRPLHD